MRAFVVISLVLAALGAGGAAAAGWTATVPAGGVDAVYVPGGMVSSGHLPAGTYRILRGGSSQGERWLRLVAPWRQGEAWVPRDAVGVGRMRYLIVVARRAGVVRLFDQRRVIVRAPATVGRSVAAGSGAVMDRSSGALRVALAEQAPVTLGRVRGAGMIAVAPDTLRALGRHAAMGTPVQVR